MKDELLDFFKTFSDINRLRMAALLSEDNLTVEQIATRLKLRPVEVPRHLAQMQKLDLLVEEKDRYRLDNKVLEILSREMLAHRRVKVAEKSNDEDADDFDRKVVKNYSLPDGRLKEIPSQEKKLLAILNHVVKVFKPGARYPEKQVNEMLARFHADTAFLRRALVDRKMIHREANGSAYWRY